MIKRAIFAAPLFALMATGPLAAQDEDAPSAEWSEGDEVEAVEGDPTAAMMGGMAAMFGEMFKVDPLTAEQEARMPLAEGLATQIMPDGVMAEMMQSMMSDLMGPLMDMGPSPAKMSVLTGLGGIAYEADLSDEQLEELATIIDPAWKQRAEREKQAIPNVMAEVATLMEPGIRKAIAEIFAINYETEELAELQSFFATETGSKFASQSYKMATDPRILGASFQAAPELIAKMGQIKSIMEEASEGLAEKKAFADLSAAEKSRISKLTGMTVADIEASMNEASQAATVVDVEEYDEESEEAYED